MGVADRQPGYSIMELSVGALPSQVINLRLQGAWWVLYRGNELPHTGLPQGPYTGLRAPTGVCPKLWKSWLKSRYIRKGTVSFQGVNFPFKVIEPHPQNPSHRAWVLIRESGRQVKKDDRPSIAIPAKCGVKGRPSQIFAEDLQDAIQYLVTKLTYQE